MGLFLLQLAGGVLEFEGGKLVVVIGVGGGEELGDWLPEVFESGEALSGVLEFSEGDEAIFVGIAGIELVGLSLDAGWTGTNGHVGFDVANQHFLVCLFAPADGLAGVWVGGIIGAIVVDGRDADGGVFGEDEWLGGLVAELPVEVVAGDIKEGLVGAIGTGEVEAEGFTADMHVGHEGEYGDIDRHGSGEGFGVAGVMRRDIEVGFGEGDGANGVLRGLFGEVDTEFELVLSFGAIGCVVNLEADAGFGGEFAGESGGIDVTGVAGDVGGPVPPDSIHTAAAWIVAGFGDIDEDMVNDAAVSGLDFVALNPAIGLVFPFDEDILIAHHAGAFDADGFGDLDDGIGFTEIPGGGEGARQGCVIGVAFGSSVIEPVEEVLLIEA